MTSYTEQIWAYLHDELLPEKKEKFEQALQNNATLSTALEDHRTTHAALQQVLPLANTLPDDQLEAELVAEWEAEHPEFAESASDTPNKKVSIIFPFLFALAASITILLMTLPKYSQSIIWKSTSIGDAPQLRGNTAIHSLYTRSELQEISDELQAQISQGANPSAKWKLQIQLQELANGALLVDVSGQTRSKPTQAKQWDKSFDSLDQFRANLSSFSTQIANDLSEQATP